MTDAAALFIHFINHTVDLEMALQSFETSGSDTMKMKLIQNWAHRIDDCHYGPSWPRRFQPDQNSYIKWYTWELVEQLKPRVILNAWAGSASEMTPSGFGNTTISVHPNMQYGINRFIRFRSGIGDAWWNGKTTTLSCIESLTEVS